MVNNVTNEVIKIDILKEAEEIIDNYIKKQSEFSGRFKPIFKKIPIVLYFLISLFIVIITACFVLK